MDGREIRAKALELAIRYRPSTTLSALKETAASFADFIAGDTAMTAVLQIASPVPVSNERLEEHVSADIWGAPCKACGHISGIHSTGHVEDHRFGGCHFIDSAGQYCRCERDSSECGRPDITKIQGSRS